ncbi:MAG TPA: hypothetical protein P5269_01475 [Syntrophales bacterium]|nr:hypothetical protein [Syntrophales bacterium]HRS86282.1 hypothetical protein [Syntrophales bacterium]HRV42693.1 hypothetical protein [Syntrophales bacterium]
MMDAGFLEFWGEALLAVARGRRQWEELTKWPQGGMSGLEGMAALFRKAYGLEGVPKDSPDYAALWEKSLAAFQESMKAFLEVFDCVPRRDLDEARARCAALEEEIAERDRAIASLKGLLAQRQPADLAEEFRRLLEAQQEHFQGLIASLGGTYRPEKTTRKRKA